MKKISLLLILFIFFYSPDLYSQQITYKDLIGTWDLTDPGEGKMYYQFIDSTNLFAMFQVGPIPDTTFKMTYRMDVINNIPRLIFTSEEYGIKHTSYFLIKVIDGNTLKMQIDFSGSSTEWADEKDNKVATFVKRY